MLNRPTFGGHITLFAGVFVLHRLAIPFQILHLLASCKTPFRRGPLCGVLRGVGGKVRQNRWYLSADVPQSVLTVGLVERCFAGGLARGGAQILDTI